VARRNLIVSITKEGRDKGKTFFLTEMPSSQGENVALRLFLALAKAGVDVPEEIQEAGLAGLATWGIKSMNGIAYQDAKEIKDEAFQSCVQIVPDPAHPEIRRGAPHLPGSVGPMVEDDIEELSTRWEIFKSIVALHVGFSSAADQSTSNAQTTAGNGPPTRTSPVPLRRSFPAG
jgi:hypothetical protein